MMPISRAVVIAFAAFASLPATAQSTSLQYAAQPAPWRIEALQTIHGALRNAGSQPAPYDATFAIQATARFSSEELRLCIEDLSTAGRIGLELLDAQLPTGEDACARAPWSAQGPGTPMHADDPVARLASALLGALPALPPHALSPGTAWEHRAPLPTEIEGARITRYTVRAIDDETVQLDFTATAEAGQSAPAPRDATQARALPRQTLALHERAHGSIQFDLAAQRPTRIERRTQLLTTTHQYVPITAERVHTASRTTEVRVDTRIQIAPLQ